MSISASLQTFDWQERKVNLIDTPGDPSFIADALGALRVCESAVFVVNAVMGVEVHTTRLWQRAAELDLARLVFVNMLDRERADFFRTLESLKAAFGQHVVATEIPIGAEHEISGVIDLIDMKAYAYDGAARENCTEIPIPDELRAQAEEYREKLMDEVSETSDTLMERYLEGEEISHEEIVAALKDGTNHGQLFPVTCGVATRNLATNRLLDAIVEDLPSPVKHGGLEVGELTLRADEDRELFAYVFKTRADPFAGRINLFRVYQGVMSHDTHVLNTRTHGKERVGQLLTFEGAETSARRRVRPRGHRRRGQAQGDPGRRLAGRPRRADHDALDQAARAGHGVRHRARDQGRRGQGVHGPAPAAGGGSDDRSAPRSPRPASRSSPGSRRSTSRSSSTRLKDRFGAEVSLKPPRVPYQETIRRPAKAHGRHKKQTGGRGPVRRLPHRDRAAAGRHRALSSSTRSRVA